MSRYKPPSVLQAMKVILSAHQDLEGIFRNLDSELAEAREVSKAQVDGGDQLGSQRYSQNLEDAIDGDRLPQDGR